MANPLFNQYGKNQNGNNSIQSFLTFAQNFRRNSNVSPKQKVQELLDSGQMSLEQFDALRNMANQLTGKNL